MAWRSLYLAKYRRSSSQRAHFALFVPNPECERPTISDDYTSRLTTGTILHVVGEPLMSGYVFEIKRNYECSTSNELKKLVHPGYLDTAHIYDPTSSAFVKEYVARSEVERQAATIPPPPRGQNLRTPVDGVTTKRCQEWTMEVLSLYVSENLVSEAAFAIAQAERDSATHGIVGQGRR